jgi:hypothetical protein
MGRNMSIIEFRSTRASWARQLTIAALALGTIVVDPRWSVAAPQDYRFELVGPLAKSGKATVIKLRLVHVPDGRPVPGAVIIQTKFDMGPDGMAEMTAPTKIVSAKEPGIYQVEADSPSIGNWSLSLAAKVQGETETVHGAVTVIVPK